MRTLFLLLIAAIMPILLFTGMLKAQPAGGGGGGGAIIPDPGFTPAVGAEVLEIAEDRAGRILVGGTFIAAGGGATRRGIARFYRNGALDAAFNPLLPEGARITAILVQPDERILVSGDFTVTVEGRSIYGIIRLEPSGSFDTAFARNIDAPYIADELKLDESGKIVGAGYGFYSGAARPGFRLNGDGTRDTSFNPVLEYVNNFRSAAIQADGKLLFGGRARSGGINLGGLVRLNPDGSLDETFQGGANDDILQIEVLEGGGILAAGYLQSYGGVTRRGIVRLFADGTLDPGFNASEVFCSNVQSFARFLDGKILIADSFVGSPVPSYLIVRLNANGSFDGSFISGFPPEENSTVRKIFKQRNGQILIGGRFSSYAGGGGEERQNLLRLGTSRLTGEEAAAEADFDGDGKTDISIFRSSAGQWWHLRSSDGTNRAFGFGAGTDKPVPADFTGDGKADMAFWRPASGEWFFLRSEDASFYSFPFGALGDIPVTGDFDADGKADAAVFRSLTATWYIQASLQGTIIRQFGAAGDILIPGDFDGDGKADLAVFRSSSGEWWINRSASDDTVVHRFGISADKPVPADYTGDGKTDIAFFRQSSGEWFILRSEDSSFYSFPFGTNGDMPAPGDYDGDGRSDPAIFRNGTWYILRSAAGINIAGFGIPGDTPLPGVGSSILLTEGDK